MQRWLLITGTVLLTLSLQGPKTTNSVMFLREERVHACNPSTYMSDQLGSHCETMSHTHTRGGERKRGGQGETDTDGEKDKAGSCKILAAAQAECRC